MSVKRIGACLAAVAGVAAGVLTATAGPAAAAPAPVDVSITAGVATLRPAANGGYLGSMNVRIRYTGPDRGHVNLRIDGPEGLYLENSDGIGACLLDARFSVECSVIDGFANGETRTLRLNFSALAKPTAKTRATLAGSVTAFTFEPELTPGDNTARFRGLMLGTGAGFDNRKYRPANVYDLSGTAGGNTVVFHPDNDGEGYAGTFTMTLRQTTDAYHQFLEVRLMTDLPGRDFLHIFPEGVCLPERVGQSCYAGDALPEGRRRTVTLTIRTDVLPPAGTQIQMQADTNIGGERAVDANPANNRVTLRVA